MKYFAIVFLSFGLIALFQNCSNNNFNLRSPSSLTGIEIPNEIPNENPPNLPLNPSFNEVEQIKVTEDVAAFKEVGPFQTETLSGLEITTKPILGGGTKTLKLNVWYPKISNPSTPLPLIIYIHGGGWMAGDQNNCLNFNSGQNSICQKESQRGFIVASITYRLSDEAKFPAQIHDVRAALKYLKTTAFTQFKIDTNRIGVLGSSAGGHLASLMGTSIGVRFGTSDGVSESEDELLAAYSKISFVVGFFSPTDLKNFDVHFAQTAAEIPNFANSNHTTDPCSGEMRLIAPLTGQPVLMSCGAKMAYSGCTESSLSMCEVDKANPLTYVNGNEPPFLLRHSYEDEVVPYQQSKVLAEALAAKGIAVDYKRIEKASTDITTKDGLTCPALGHNFHSNVFSLAESPKSATVNGKPSLICAYKEAIESCDSALQQFDKNLKEISNSTVTCL